MKTHFEKEPHFFNPSPAHKPIVGSFYVATSAQSVVFLPAARTPACFQAAALPQPPLNINWWGNEKHITGNGHGAQRERAYLRDKRFPWAFNFHAKAHSGEIVIKYIVF
jgi:hypothetical protein